MTEQPDLKARVEELERENAALTKALTGLTRGAINALHDKKAAESRLALAEKVVEAGRVFARIRPSSFYAPDGSENECYSIYVSDCPPKDAEFTGGDLARLRAALAAYAENTSSNDLTTGEDDA